MDRRTVLRARALGMAAAGLFPAWASSGTPGLAAGPEVLTGQAIRLKIGHSPFTLGGRKGHAITAVSYTHLDVYKRQP